MVPPETGHQCPGTSHPGQEAVIAENPRPRFVRWAIALITAFFVVMMFSPLVHEIVRRVRLSTPVNVP